MNQLTEDEKELILRVASLIEEGSAGMQQITGHYMELDGSGCCAMGAMLRALNITTIEAQSHRLNILHLLDVQSWPRMGYPISDLTPFAANPKTDLASLPDVVIFLNDRLHWDFKRIVDWLRSSATSKV